MQVIPAIDLMGGECVQLVGGRPETRKNYGNPLDYADKWVSAGAKCLHVVDLDATLGLGDNLDAALKLRKAGVPIQFGGGIRSLEKAKRVLDSLSEKDRIIMGSLAVKEYPGFQALKQLIADRDRIIVAVDSKEGKVAVKGWQKKSELEASQVMAACEELVWGFLYTDVDVEGRMEGVNADGVRQVVEATSKPVIVSGGVSSEKDIEACESAGAWGVVLGKALYEGKIRLEDVV